MVHASHSLAIGRHPLAEAFSWGSDCTLRPICPDHLASETQSRAFSQPVHGPTSASPRLLLSITISLHSLEVATQCLQLGTVYREQILALGTQSCAYLWALARLSDQCLLFMLSSLLNRAMPAGKTVTSETPGNGLG